ncbi:MAG: hypothetical protein RJA99_3196 [Pseudomonadota bacterium]|jgi:hypothetical protein
MADVVFKDGSGYRKPDVKYVDMGDGTFAEVVSVVGGGGGGGGASGSVTAAGVNGTSAQAVQGIDNGVPISAYTKNITTKFRDAFEVYTPGSKWTETKASGDLVYVDGNAAGASYLVISKDPLSAGTESRLESILAFSLPVEVAIGLSMSQRTLGQEFAVEVVDNGTPLAAFSDLAISSISQATTTLTVDTVLPHGLSVGRCIGIRDCSNPLANYPSLVVASTPTPTQFTATAGPGGTIASQTITNPTGAKGFVYQRERLGRANNGVSMIFENATVTNASAYIRSESGDGLPSGAIAGNQSLTFGTTAPIALVSAAYQYAWSPTTEFKLLVQTDRSQWADAPVDTTAAMTSRLARSQVCPDPDAEYELRLRAVNNKSLTVPNAQIVSATKTGTTTATVVTATPHGLAAADPVVIYGIRDQAAASFPNLLTATAVASVVDATTFTIVIGTASTVTSYGGYVAKVQGGNLMSALGAVAQVIQSAVLSTLTDGTRQLVLTGSAAWGGLSIGDLVNVVGCRDNTAGATVGVDGAWKVANIVSTALTLVLPYSGSMTLPADFGSVNCGGAVIKRTDLRVSFVRVFDYERQRVEVLSRPASDIAASLPVAVNNTPAVTVSSGTVTTVSTVTTVTGVTTVSAVTAANLGIPGIIADVASAALTSTATTAAFTPTFGTAYSVSIPVTAVTGTTPTLDVSIEESDDSGTNWFRVYDFPRITATGMYRSPIIRMTGNRVRYVQTVSGTTPSFTRAINRLQSSSNSEPVRQLIDRSVVLTTLNSTTPSLDARDAGNRVQMVVNVGAITTTAPALQLEGSDDNGASWYAIGSPLTAVASSTVQLTAVDINSALIRARVSTAGVGVTAGYVMIKAHD